MNSQLKEDAHILCQRIRELTNQIDKKIDTESTINTQNQVMENIKLNIKEKKNFDRPPAGKKVTRWDNTIIDWKSSLRNHH
jgi:hypothetical protein